MAKSKAGYWLTQEGITLLKGWAKDGLTDKQIAKNMGISKDTFYKYKKKYIDFSDALKKSKEIADYEVENALYKRALGYRYTEVTKYKAKDEKGQEFVRVTEVTKEFPPDTGACMAWLKNRKSSIWRDKQDIDNSNTLERLDKLLEAQKNA